MVAVVMEAEKAVAAKVVVERVVVMLAGMAVVAKEGEVLEAEMEGAVPEAVVEATEAVERCRFRGGWRW